MFERIRVVLAEVSKGFSVIVAPRGRGTTVSFSIPGRTAVALLVVVCVLIAGLAFSGYTYVRLATLVMRVVRLEHENEALRAETGKIDAIMAEMAEIEKMRRKIESWAGITPAERSPGGSGEGAYAYVPMWPRRYSYEIMRDVYLYRARHLPEMVVPASGWVSRWFVEGPGGGATHPGVDIVAATGTPVRAALGGTVTFAGWDDVYGKVVRVEHNDSLTTVYGHNDEVLVEVGDRVAKGEVIAKVGNTGRSTAPHLHFEVLKNGIAEDPELYVNFGRDR